ncbi:neprilysin-1-like [Dermacentor silvarum]|uniref:neprilysin-1-like n=1 Tax=Dermacentor silvarum TaxID=543639 RepID=UPI0021011432|nr:neprilysin-1-like [Dermacentor silvarum]
MSKHNIPESESTTSSFFLLDDKLRETLRDILGNATVVEEGQTATDKAVVVYNACMAVPRLEDRRDVILAIMNASGLSQWPLTYQPKDQKANAEDVLVQTGIATVLSVGVSRNLRNLSSYSVQLDQPDFTTIGRNEIINQTTDYSMPIIKAYKDVIEVALKFMKPNLTDAKLAVLSDKLLDFEGKLANLTAPPEERRDLLEIYHRTTIDELERNFSNIPIRALLQKQFDNVNITLAHNETVELFALKYYEKLNEFLRRSDVDTLYNYAGLRRMLRWAATVSREFREVSFKLRKVKEGVQVERPRWQICVDEVNDDMPDIVGKLYVERKFSPEAKKEVQDLVRRLMAVFNESLQRFQWMDKTTREAAEAKLTKMATKIGYPDWLFNTTYIEELYKFVPKLLLNGSYGAMMYALSRNHWKQEMLKLRRPYNRDAAWQVGPAVVNAFYSPNANEMMFPSGILQGVFYEHGLPRSINFGAIGTVVGHEMTHGFDDTGSQFDADGALKQWWTKHTRTEFMERTKCFVYEYGNITDMQVNMTLNGKNTVGENIADNGGLRLAFEAYKRLLEVEYKNIDTRLKGLEEFSGEQLFFIANAMVMCTLSRPEYVKEQIQYDPHSPSQYSVNVPISNLADFSNTFNCPANSTMNRKDRCTFW